MNVSSLRALSALAVLVVLTACGGDEEPAPQEPTATALSLSPTEQSVPTGGAALTLTAAGGSGSYTWALSPASGAGSLSATLGTSVQYTPPASTSGPVVATVTVSSGSERAVAVLRVEPRAVQGRVLTFNGKPVPGATVALVQPGGAFNTVASDAQGRFSFANVPATYDLVLVERAVNTAVVYLGLTRSDPVLTAYGNSGPPGVNASTAALSGAVSNLAPPDASTTRHAVVALSAASAFELSFPNSNANSTTGAYSLSEVQWVGASTTTGTLHALQISKNASAVPTAYPGYGKLEGIAFAAGDSISGKNVALAPVASAAFTATVQPATGVSLTSRSVLIQFGPHAISELYNGGSATGTTPIAIATPVVPGAAFALVATGSGAAGDSTVLRSGLGGNATGVTLAVPAPATREAPANGATGVAPGNSFSWSSVPGAVNLVALTPSVSGNPTLMVATSATRFALPSLAALGIALPPSTAYSWSVTSIAPVASVDAFAVPGGYIAAFYEPLRRTSAGESALLTTNSSFTFTTAP